ncbi:MAG: hypothetical protein HZT40_20035 [Candidatus Thiothrix singaporensis]|uniref:Uncharacterized protein n=1 Tax=Candidatus Thiothrix singaporensis TaxID=2799669 RepID=A0A7L6AWD8_9GAMM|nr:MAG: hypothetical protein HZT40_20035 [Candidatus Thiothrix singaporensis]
MGSALAARLNQMLEKANRITGASDIYLLRPDGLTIAASNWDQGKLPSSARTFPSALTFSKPCKGGWGAITHWGPPPANVATTLPPGQKQHWHNHWRHDRQNQHFPA